MKTNVQDTSRIAFHTEILPDLGRRQKEVLEALGHFENRTNAEISEYIGLPINSITPRVHELRQKGLVEEACRRKCNATGRTAIAWKIIKYPIQSQLL